MELSNKYVTFLRGGLLPLTKEIINTSYRQEFQNKESEEVRTLVIYTKIVSILKLRFSIMNIYYKKED